MKYIESKSTPQIDLSFAGEACVVDEESLTEVVE